MTRARSVPAVRHHMAGLSLIEMMISMVMALIVAAGIITVFTSTSSSNKVQLQMAALQEEGRFAIHSLRTDLGNANGGYCSNTGGNAGEVGSGLFLDALRSPTVYSTTSLAPAGGTANVFPDNTVALPDPTQAYSLPSSFFMKGYQCTTSACLPSDPNTLISSIPAMGTAPGNRVRGTDVLTVRYIKPGSGWAIMPATSAIGSKMAVAAGTATITLAPMAGEQNPPNFTGPLAMLADCSNAQVFTAGIAGTTITIDGSSGGPNYANPSDITSGAAPRIFDFPKDFETVTYYVQVVCANGVPPCADGRTTGELVRRVNGGDANAANGGHTDQLVRGVERLNFLYGIIDANGGTRFLTANEVDTGLDASGSAIPCYIPPYYTGSDVALPGGMPDAGCLWRAVQTIQVSILMDGQTPLYTLKPAELQYVYTPDGNSMQPPAGHAVQPNADQGFPNELIRREFTTLIALRNFNP